jgi:ribosomal protein S18 acetylase RimI-like enzyme
MEIRRASLFDARLLAGLNMTVQQLHAENRPEIFKPPLVSDELVNWYEEMLSQTENHVFIGEVNGEAVGYLCAKVVHRPENPFTYALHVIYVEEISVNEEYQGRGCGKQLMQAAYELAQVENIRRIMLNVWNFNSQAISFYKSLGFQVCHERMEQILG